MTRRLLLCLLLVCLVAALAVAAGVETLDNGLRVVVQPISASPVVSVTALVDFSDLDVPPPYAGVRQVLLSALAQRPAEPGSARARLAAMGAMLQARQVADALEFTITVPADTLELALDAQAEWLRGPVPSAETVAMALVQTRRMQETDSGRAADTAKKRARALLYAEHPYYADGLGSPQSLEFITPELVRLAYREFVIPPATVIAVAGDADAARTRAAIATRFGDWPFRPRVPRDDAPMPALTASVLDVREAPVNSTCVMLTFPACGAEHADFLPLHVLDAVLSGGTGARLFRTIREEQQLAYEVATFYPSQRSSSAFSVYAVTNTQELEAMKHALVTELGRLQTEEISPEELARAQAYLKGRYQLSHQYSAQQAFDLAWSALLGTDLTGPAFAAKIDAVTAADLQRVARDYFTRYYLVVVLPRG